MFSLSCTNPLTSFQYCDRFNLTHFILTKHVQKTIHSTFHINIYIHIQFRYKYVRHHSCIKGQPQSQFWGSLLLSPLEVHLNQLQYEGINWETLCFQFPPWNLSGLFAIPDPVMAPNARFADQPLYDNSKSIGISVENDGENVRNENKP